MFPIFGLGIIGFIILFASQYGKVKKQTTIIGGIFFILTFVVFIVGFSLLDSFLNSVHKDLILFLKDNRNNIEVKVNGKEYRQSTTFLKNLNNISQSPGHHSSPTKSIQIELISPNGNRLLTLMQDSEIKNEFWVFVDNYKNSSKNEIGRIHSDYFIQFITLTVYEKWNEKLKESKMLENKIGKQNIDIEYIYVADTNKTENIQIINKSFDQVKWFYYHFSG
jgi:hypothetical protein